MRKAILRVAAAMDEVLMVTAGDLQEGVSKVQNPFSRACQQGLFTDLAALGAAPKEPGAETGIDYVLDYRTCTALKKH